MNGNAGRQYFMWQENDSPRFDCAFGATGEGTRDNLSIPGCPDATEENLNGNTVAENIIRFRKKCSLLGRSVDQNLDRV